LLGVRENILVTDSESDSDSDSSSSVVPSSLPRVELPFSKRGLFPRGDFSPSARFRVPRVLEGLEVFDCEFTCWRLSLDVCCSMPRAELAFDCAKMDGALIISR
jgi:hypothetical protein